MSNKKKKTKRGFPVALLISLEEDRAVFWRVFSEMLKLDVTIKRGRKRKNQDDKQLYEFHEQIVNALRPIVRSGLRSVIIVTPSKESFYGEFKQHIDKHHSWMQKPGDNQVVFNEIKGDATNPEQLEQLVQQEYFKEQLHEGINDEATNLLDLLDKIINTKEEYQIYYALKEIEGILNQKRIPDNEIPDYILLTDDFLDNHPQKNRINRVLQLAQNKGIKNKVIYSDSDAGKRLTQLGGLVCFRKN